MECIYNIKGIIFPHKKISISEDNLIIQYLFTSTKKSYKVKDIKKMVIGGSYDEGTWIRARGIKIIFKTGDMYEFIQYDYLNFGAFRRALEEFRKVYDVTFI